MVPFKVGSVEVKLTPAAPVDHPPASSKTVELEAGHRKRPECRPLPTPIILDQDQEITLRDGAKIRTDIYRPKTAEKVPAIVMWGPYGKSGSGLLNISFMPLRANIPEDKLSGYEDFEGLDPAEWVPKGYAVVNVDSRGTGDSDGDILWWGTAEGRDGYDAIEELAKLPWCNGKIALAGNSWLAISQWFIAAEQPPHLAAIAPLEGASDPYREDSFRGGVPWTTFSRMITSTLQGRNQQEDWPSMVESTNTTNDYFEDKRADFSKIQVPAYIGASYSSDIHTVGSLRAFEEIPHESKWLVLHATQEWYDLYTPERTEDLNNFFEYYLKDIQNDWLQSPPVRLALLRHSKPAIIDIPFDDLPWHLPSAVSNKLYLTPDRTLSQTKAQPGQITYKAHTSEAVTFTYTFPKKTTIVGPSTLFIDISAPSHDDIDVYTHLFKADKTGIILYHDNIGIPNTLSAEEKEKLTTNRLFRYHGPNGVLRASQRNVSVERSGKTWKTLSHEKVQKLTPGERISLEIQLWPTGMIFEEGEHLHLKISGEKIGLPGLPQLGKIPSRNKGENVLYLGEEGEARLEFFTIDV
ncbi:Alpha/Beta hydrolase protein [Aspergillus pseudoustus]|uniref:Alpha/Beta hydrolase protein n=1 Tax=Aspergillus pseudoustus TaxID=1810923 RepID=A0ABR4JUL3_9EURO